MTLAELCENLKNIFSIEFFIVLSLCSIGLLILLIIYLVFINKKYKIAIKDININKNIKKILSKDNEIVSFNQENNVIYATNQCDYKNKDEFISYLTQRMAITMDFKAFCDALNNNEQFHTVLKSNDSYAKRLMVSNYSSDSAEITTVMTDISNYCFQTDELMKSYKKLEAFIDNLPLGIFYIDTEGKILGCNLTFATYLKIGKDKIIGSSINEYIEDFELDKIYDEALQVTLKARYFSGIQVFLIKPPLVSFNSLQPLIVLKSSEIIKEQKPTVPANNNEETFKYSAIPAIIIDKAGNILKQNKSFFRLVEQQEITNITKAMGQSSTDKPADFVKALEDPQGKQLELQLNFGNGHTKIVQVYMSQIANKTDGTLLVQIVDVSSQKVMEQQFLQSQKIQAIGQLASGIAHDFNNLLTAMIGFCDLLLQRYTPNDPSYEDVVQIKQNAGRAANLVKQLLAFSRQQTLKPKVVMLSDLLLDISPLLKRLMGPNIDFRLNPGQDLWLVKVDNSQFEQIVMNLVVNARDAMKNKGILVIQTRNFYADRSFQCVDAVAPAGDYVLLEVVDNGCGMDEETVQHIFEPFFTRKIADIKNGTGSGTGLGLATVYGIVNQTGGFIKIDSQVGKGTAFRIFLPRYKGTEEAANPNKRVQFEDLSGTETILLVEDEEAVRKFAVRALKDKGYNVVEAANGVEALQVAENIRIDLLITDVIMPKIDGPMLNTRLREKIGNFKTIFISGYTEDTFRQNLDKDLGIHFMQKPFTLKELANKVKEVLAG